ncbi:MAG: TonB family C-domain protein [Deltaproteobacteria bacterium]|nr:TonB family C-domain protein [Deltaproteobacteria bacterium]
MPELRAAIAALVVILASALAGGAGADPSPAPAVARSASGGDVVPHGPSLDERLDAIQRRVQAALVYPPIARLRRTQGTALLAFEIGADGRARGVAVAHSSGFAALDRAALRAVHAVDQLPYVYGRLEIPVHFELAARAPEVAISN